MKCKIPEISWHNRDPVLSVDIQPKNDLAIAGGNTNRIYRLASGGTDAHVLIWYITLAADGSDIDLDLAADLARHQRAVNAVKWSPNGELLASGDDESVVFIWKQKADSDPLNILDNTNDQDKEVWITLKILRGHMEDIYDLSWSPNSLFLVSGSVDNTAIIWDVHKGKSLSILNDHKGFVQGVAWDPKNQYIATLSTDRYLRIFDIQTKRVLHRIYKGTLPVAEGHELHGHRMRLFHDDTLQTFFRRLSFTPDGKLLLTPAGVTDYDGVVHPLHTTYAFSRYALRQPAIVLPCSDQYTVAVRCCPLLFSLRPHNATTNPPVVPLPYRMIFAVATRSSVYFYDTQQRQPFALISNIHYTRLTDVTWSSDGRIVVVSSTDGFCSLITFQSGELGEEYENSEFVLGDALITDIAPVNTKKLKKQKENDSQQKFRKSSTDEVKIVGSVTREKFLEKVVEKKLETEEKGALKNSQKHKLPTPIAIRRKEKNEKELVIQKKEAQLQKSPTPIAIKRKENNGNESKIHDKEAQAQKLLSPIAIKCKENVLKEPEIQEKAVQLQKSPTSIAIKCKEDNEKRPKIQDNETQAHKLPTPIVLKLNEKIQKVPQIHENEAQNFPTPIATKRKGSVTVKQNTAVDNGGIEELKEKIIEKDQKAEKQKVPTPIAIKRKGATTSDSDTNQKPNSTVVGDGVAKEFKVATPIAIKRKSTTTTRNAKISENSEAKHNIIVDDDVAKPALIDKVVEDDQKAKKEQKVLTPITIKRKETTTKSTDTNNQESVEKEISSAAVVSVKTLTADIIIDKEILGSDEKFETPEKKSRPVTPISVRRTPRGSSTATATITPKSIATIPAENNSSLTSLNSPRQQKKATPIAVRRAPRGSLIAPVAPNPVLDTPTIVEEAMDAWPLKYSDDAEEEENTTLVALQIQHKIVKPLDESVPKEFASEHTEDIRLVYEDTVEEIPTENAKTTEASVVPKTSVAEESLTVVTPVVTETTAIVAPNTPNPKQQTPNNKTPRRVALKTISTPKSKKKLL